MNKQIIDDLATNKHLCDEDYRSILTCKDEEVLDYLFEKARGVAQENFGNKIYVRGLIEFSNYCKNDCYYCGLRASNRNVDRYALTKAEILESCVQGYELGYRTFVLQSGENNFYKDDRMCDIIETVSREYPDCAITLSMGEKSKETYQKYFNAGAHRYLLRHESVNFNHYQQLHPHTMSIDTRIQALKDLKDIGFQTGSGIMVGTPHQSVDNLIEDIHFLEALQPEMIGVGPFLPHNQTPFKDEKKGSEQLTLVMISILRLMHPFANMPATTALATIDSLGRERGVRAGANVVMPNLSPMSVREKYQLYNEKACLHALASSCAGCLPKKLEKIGYELSYEVGHFQKEKSEQNV